MFDNFLPFQIPFYFNAGLQGALLDNLLEPIFIDSITLSEGYTPDNLVRAFCCRLARDDTIEHPWIQFGWDKKLKSYKYKGDDNISVYWTHADLGRKSSCDVFFVFVNFCIFLGFNLTRTSPKIYLQKCILAEFKCHTNSANSACLTLLFYRESKIKHYYEKF